MEKITKLYKGKVEVKFLGPTDESPNRHMYYVGGKRVSGVTTFLNIKDKSKGLTSWYRDTIGDHLLTKLKNGQKITREDIFEAMVQPDVKKQKAADLGTKIHAWCESYIKHKLKLPGFKTMPEMPEEREVQMGAAAFLAWDAEHKVKYEDSEQLVYSKKYNYVGTLDIRAVVDGKLSLVDLKSSNALYNDVRMQTAAYVHADEEESGRKYKQRWALRLSKYTESEHYERETLKKELKRVMAQFNGKEFKDYTIPEYKVFEAKFIDDEHDDFAAFLNAMNLYRWNYETDFYRNGTD